ncbi:MAG TPA: GGDEF domain-containing protein [Candidatus Avoscillospira avistercoris]|uniref:GGDEF domain-containing protein n=1 Tax=Candidatus Avoscillospira avistercoris TaxID=2840707 RepID=A0A9D1F914_9FIRM|nr:GGDEF domain-containing protein [Candidatus Avoscillospira avistercoris]
MTKQVLLLGGYLLTLFLFHQGTAILAVSLDREQANQVPRRYALIPSAVNGTLFILCNMAHLGLMANWLIILPVLYLELRYLMHIRRWLAIGLALETVICGLSAILFYRSLLAIVLQKPLYAFDNSIHSQDIWAPVPVLLGLLSGYFVFRRYANTRKRQSMRYLLTGGSQLRFLAACMILALVFLAMQAYLYENNGQTSDDIHTKLWSLVSCLYIPLGYLFALRYAIQVSILSYMSDCNVIMQQDLDRRAREEEALLETIEVDELTGVLTRLTGQQRILEAFQAHRQLCLCMVDLDGLKYINDHLGHKEGDRYLRTVAEILAQCCRQGKDVVCRYGGDEFLLAFVGAGLSNAQQRMTAVTGTLAIQAKEIDLPMVLSYGVAQWEPGESFETVLERADQEMYAMKSQHKAEMPDRVR